MVFPQFQPHDLGVAARRHDIRADLDDGAYELRKRRAYRFYTSATWPETPHSREANYALGAVYRQRVHRDWLFVELMSAVEFPQADDYDLNPMIGVTMEILFSRD